MSKDFIYEGDTVKIKQKIPNAPEMVVEEIEKIREKVGDSKKMVGIRCFWFTSDGHIQKNRFDFKDLRVIKRSTDYDH